MKLFCYYYYKFKCKRLCKLITTTYQLFNFEINKFKNSYNYETKYQKQTEQHE